MASIAPRDYRQPENTNIEKVGPTYFLNLFRAVVSLCRLALVMVCKLCPKEKLPPHLQNPVVNDCDENHLRNILNLSQVRMRSVSVEKDKSEFHLPHFRVFRVFRGLKP